MQCRFDYDDAVKCLVLTHKMQGTYGLITTKMNTEEVSRRLNGILFPNNTKRRPWTRQDPGLQKQITILNIQLLESLMPYSNVDDQNRAIDTINNLRKTLR